MSTRGKMTRRGFLGGLFGGPCLAGQKILMLRAPARYDYYVDDVTGADSNDGLTPATPWQSLNKLETIPFSAGDTKRVLVKSGTYDKTSDHFELNNNSAAAAVLDVTFEPGCVMDGTASSISSAQNPIYAQGSQSWTLILQGNGLVIQHYDYNVGGASPQGLGNGGTNTILAYDVHVIDCVQGVSSHNSAIIKMYGGTITNCVAQAIAPVDTSRNELYGVTVDQSANAQKLADLGGATTCLFEDCWFVGAAAGTNSLEVGGGTFRRCRMGTLTTRIAIESVDQGGSLEDCYLNAQINGGCTVDMTRCYGKLTTRMHATNNITAEHCVFVGGASGATNSVLYRNSDLNQGTWEFGDCVLKGYATCLGSAYGATDAGYFVAAGNFATYINYFGNTVNVDPDLLSAAGASVTTGVITTDPQIGPANSYDQDDYAVGPMSPCIGAGSGGEDIGFQAAA